jgi:hypothetical protein
MATHYLYYIMYIILYIFVLLYIIFLFYIIYFILLYIIFLFYIILILLLLLFLTLKRSLEGLCNRLFVCLSVCLSVTPLLQRVQNHMSKGNRRNQPERQNASQALMTSLYIQSTLKRDLHREFYTVLINLCLEKRWIIYYAR